MRIDINRTYDLVPKDVGKFLSLSAEKFHLRTSHSVLLGYWTTELGGLNQVVHLWQYGGSHQTLQPLSSLQTLTPTGPR